MAEPFLGEIRIFAFTFAPTGWAFCDGQVLPISQNTALFSLLGTTYGGNGQSTFALPDLRGRAPEHMGQGPGRSNRVLGETGGDENVTLTAGQIPAHTHTANCSNLAGNQQTPGGGIWASAFGHSFHPHDHVGRVTGYQSGGANAQMAAGAIGNTGGGGAHNNMPPFLVLNFCIAMQGILPSRA